jgi:hypothetical protein
MWRCPSALAKPITACLEGDLSLIGDLGVLLHGLASVPHASGDCSGTLGSARFGANVAYTLAARKRISYRRVNVRWMTPLGDETASMS